MSKLNGITVVFTGELPADVDDCFVVTAESISPPKTARDSFSLVLCQSVRVFAGEMVPHVSGVLARNTVFDFRKLHDKFCQAFQVTDMSEVVVQQVSVKTVFDTATKALQNVVTINDVDVVTM